MTQSGRKLEAPHRRLQSSSRVLEKTAVISYKLTSAVLAYLPPRLSIAVIGRVNQLGYLVWPTKRSYSNGNFAHVLGLPADHPEVRRMALRAYKAYARYMVETMRLPSRSQEEIAGLLDGDGIDRMEANWRAHGKSVIVACGHVGNNEAVAAGIAWRGLPANVVADDSAYPEIFEILRKQRESWGLHVVPWRNLRELFKILRGNQLVALLVDWGYRPDGIPVKMFGAWTALPAGPAVLAAKTGAAIITMASHRLPNGQFRVETGDPFTVPSSDPADLQRATQRIADALERTVAAAPEQWYSFKPVWPADPADVAELERRATEMLAGRAGAPLETGPAS